MIRSIRKLNKEFSRPRRIKARIIVGFSTWLLVRKSFTEEIRLDAVKAAFDTSSMLVKISVMMKFALTGRFGFIWKIDSLRLRATEAITDIFIFYLIFLYYSYSYLPSQSPNIFYYFPILPRSFLKAVTLFSKFLSI